MKSGRYRSFLDPEALARLGRVPLTARGPVEGAFSGIHKSPHRGASVEFSQYREYVKGDDIRRLDWRLWGRTDRFYLKEFEADTNLRLYLLVDVSASMAFGGDKTKLDYAKALAGTLAYLALRQGDAVGLVLFADRIVKEIPPRHHPAHSKAILDALEQAVPKGETLGAKALHDVAGRIRRRALAVIISDLFDDLDKILPAFAHFCHRKHDLAVFHLLDPSELDFPFERPTLFQDLETGRRLTCEPAVIRSQYLKNLRDYLDRLRAETAKNKVDYRLVRSDVPYDRVLGEFLTRRYQLYNKGG